MENELPLAVRDSTLLDVVLMYMYTCNVHDNVNVSKLCNDVIVNVIG